MTWLFNTFCISGKKELLCVLLGATSAYWNFPENERGDRLSSWGYLLLAVTTMCSDSSCLLPVGGGFSGGEFFPSGFSHALNFWHVLCSLAGEATTSCLQWVTSSLMPEWDLKGAVPEQGGSAQQVCLALLHGGLVHSFVLCQTWSKCSDDKIVPAPFFFFSYSQYLFSAVAKSFIPTTGWELVDAKAPQTQPSCVEHKCMEIKGIRNLDQGVRGIL